MRIFKSLAGICVGAAALVVTIATPGAQDRLHAMPGFDQFRRCSR